jgi:hypothetical protein
MQNQTKPKKQIHIVRQSKLKSEQTAYRVLGAILRFQDVEANDNKFSRTKSVKWTIDVLSEHLGIEYESVAESVYWLVMKGYLECRGTQYFRTVAGDVAWHEATEAIHFAAGNAQFEWRTEVLSGMDKDGDQTQIDRAAIPATGRIDNPRNKEEDSALKRISSERRFQRIADDVGMSLADTIDGITEGSISICNSCGKWARHHRHNGTGKRFQSACISCRKGKRR